MDKEVVEKEMEKLAKNLQYEFKNIHYLSKAMCCDKSNNKYTNQPLSTLGDTILKFTLTEYLYNQGKSQKQITEEKSKIEDNSTLCKICDRLKIYDYAYNDKYFSNRTPKAPGHEKLPTSKHNIYMESIIAAIYKDRGIRYCKKWIIKIWRENRFIE